MPSKISSPDEGTIFLLRHGDIRSGGGKRYIGWQDHPLSDVGLAQARRWAGYFSDKASRTPSAMKTDAKHHLMTLNILGLFKTFWRNKDANRP